MTYPEFLEKLRQTPRDWKLDGPGGIRRVAGTLRQCPLSSLCDLYPEATDGYSAGKTLGFDEYTIRNVIHAVDFAIHHDKNVRKDLLKACGL